MLSTQKYNNYETNLKFLAHLRFGLKIIVYIFSGPAKYVRLGEHDMDRTDDAAHVDFNVIETFFHENVPSETFNEIVLLKLDRKVEFNDAIRPACLAQELTVPNKAVATGWGSVARRRIAQMRSNILRKVELEIFSRNELSGKRILRYVNKYDEDTIVFAGHHKESRDTCFGDGGGPLQILHETHYCTYTLLGVIVSGSSVCGLFNEPTVCARVYSHLSWIEDTVWPKEEIFLIK